MTPGNTHRRSGNTGETKPFVGNSSDDHSGPSESQDPESHVNQISAKTISGSLPPSFVDKLLELLCTKCNTSFSSRNEDAHPYFAYCDIVCGQCVNNSEFTGTRCEKCESQWPTRFKDAGENGFKRYDALFDLYAIIEKVDMGYRCTKCCKLHPIKNTVQCTDARDHDNEPVKSDTGYVVCVWCARDNHEGHLRVFLDETRDQPSKANDNTPEFIHSFDSSCMKPYFLIHCANCGRMFLNNNQSEKPSAITISCGHLIGTDPVVCCDAVNENPDAMIDCKFCEKSVPMGSELHHFKYLNDFLGEFEPYVDCSEGCERSHSKKNCEDGNKCIWCVIEKRKLKEVKKEERK